MNASEIQLTNLLPVWMQDDTTAAGMAYAVEKQLKAVAAEISLVGVYARIPTMGESLLDELAWGLNIPEYRGDYELDVKRRLVQTAIQTHRLRGTKAAVEKVVTEIFGDGWVEEWFEYDGDAYKFKIHTSNIGAVDADAAAFDHAVENTKNLRSVLEEIVIEASGQLMLYAAAVMRVQESIYIN